MQTTMLVRHPLPQGCGALVIYQSARAYYVVHEDAQGQYTALEDARFWTYDAAQSRLQHELQARQPQQRTPVSREGVRHGLAPPF